MTSEYDAVADAYNSTLDPEGVGLSDPVLEGLLGDLAGRVVLSLACGQGRDARMLADRGAAVVGIDVSRRLLEFAREFEANHPRGIDYLLGDAQELTGLADGSFDGVLCHLALIDIPRLDPTIAAVRRVLLRDGWFVFSIVHPCYEPHVRVVPEYSAEERYRKVDGWSALPGHAYHRPLSHYVNCLADNGFLLERMIEPPDSPATGNVPNLLYARARLLG